MQPNVASEIFFCHFPIDMISLDVIANHGYAHPRDSLRPIGQVTALYERSGLIVTTHLYRYSLVGQNNSLTKFCLFQGASI